MAKFKIAQNPTFSTDVSIPRVGGDPVEVKFTYRTLGRKQLAAVYDKWSDSAKGLSLDDPELTFARLTNADLDLQVQQIKDIVVGWGFEDEFNDESIAALCDTCTQAAQTIVEAYRLAYAENRSKN
ncbi:hypothetical protein D3C85_1049040 [compost metagenome]